MASEKEHLCRLYILTPNAEFRGHLRCLATINMPCRSSLLHEKTNIANLTKKRISIPGSSTSHNQTNAQAHATTAR